LTNTPHRICSLLLLAAFALPGTSRAENTDGDPGCCPPQGCCAGAEVPDDRCADCYPDPKPCSLGVWGVGWGSALDLSVSAGGVLGDVRRLGPLHSATGWLFQAELGLGGAALRTGPALVAKLKLSHVTVNWPLLGVAVTGSLLRTWEKSAYPRDYAGVELLLTAVTRLRVGHYWRLDGSERTWRWTLGLGF